MIPLFRKTILLSAGLFLIAISSFGQVKSGAYSVMLNGLLNHKVPELGVKEAAHDQIRYLFLDAREPREYAVSHIEGAILVGYDHFTLENVPAKLPKDQRIIVYCSVGYRSEKVTEKLQQAGFTQVFNLYGGIFEWVNQNHPVVNQNGPTHDVHPYSSTWGIWLKKGNKVYK